MKVWAWAGNGIIAISALIGLPAMAADMAVKAPFLAPAAAESWTGFYVGGNLGGAWTNTDGALRPIDPSAIKTVTGNLGTSAAIGGFQEGINWQFAPKWVVGFEGDWSFTNASRNIFQGGLMGPVNPIANSNGAIGQKLDWLASARNRLGYLVTPNLMIFGTGGLAIGKVEYSGSTSINDPTGLGTYASAVASNHISGGWVAGGGLEWMWGGHWLLRGEYLYYHLNSGQAASSTNPFASGAGVICLGPCPTSATSTYSWSSMNVNQLRAALSYKF
jgi:outer membrane immunogenic protein